MCVRKLCLRSWIVLSQLLIVALFLYLGTVKCCGNGSNRNKTREKIISVGTGNKSLAFWVEDTELLCCSGELQGGQLGEWGG